SVQYALANGIKGLSPVVYCSSGYAHELHVFVTAEDAIPAAPRDEIIVPVDLPDSGGDVPQQALVTLPEEIRLEAGERLVVGVETVTYPEGGGNVSAICVSACKDDPTEPVNYWSDVTTAPYEFEVIDEGRFVISVDGTYYDKQ